MIKLPVLLLPFALLYGGTSLFLLPDDQSRFAHQLGSALRHGSENVLVVTPVLHYPEIKKAILTGIKRGSRIILVTQKPEFDPLSLIQYDNTEFYTYSARPMEGSVILVGERLVCTLPAALDGDELRQNASVARCSSSPSEIEAFRSVLLPLLKRSHPYLQ